METSQLAWLGREMMGTTAPRGFYVIAILKYSFPREFLVNSGGEAEVGWKKYFKFSEGQTGFT